MHLLVVAIAFSLLPLFLSAVAGVTDSDRSRMDRIAPMLRRRRFHSGPPVSDRTAWERAKLHPAMSGIIATAEAKIAEPVPAMTLEIYGQYKATGRRTEQYRDVRYNRHERIALYTLAECLENRGRFILALESIIKEVCAEPTWLYNFHDGNLDGWNGGGRWIDLGVVVPASDTATALALLEDRMSPATQELIVKTCRDRIFEPYRRMIDNEPNSWAYSEMNWNAVCHAGVVATALAISDEPTEQAYFIAMAEKLSVNYLRGFATDGYCSEGTGYWNYGFGNFALMSQLVLQATDGQVNLFDLPGAKQVAMYPTRMEIINGLAPSFADCGLDPKPDGNLFNLLNRHYGLGLAERPADPILMRLISMLGYVFQDTRPALIAEGENRISEVRDYFDHGGVLIGRPTNDGHPRLGVALKGGHNAEEHNHNDVGTFVVAVGRSLLILDPGLETYSARTFGKDRYESKLLNSYGHPVPVVAGRLQRQGRDARADVVKADFSDARDVWTLDLRTAYDVPELQSLTRTFTYDRSAAGTLMVVDEVAFDSPQTFSTALITYGVWKRTGPASLSIEHGEDRIDVNIDADGLDFELTSETIDEQTPANKKPTRISIASANPITRGRLKVLITAGKAD